MRHVSSYNESVDIYEKLVSVQFESLNMHAHKHYNLKRASSIQHVCGLLTTLTLLRSMI